MRPRYDPRQPYVNATFMEKERRAILQKKQQYYQTRGKFNFMNSENSIGDEDE